MDHGPRTSSSCPGYQDMARPFGESGRRGACSRPRLWRKRARFSSDVGAAAMNPNAAGQTVESVGRGAGDRLQPAARAGRTARSAIRSRRSPSSTARACGSATRRSGWSIPTPSARARRSRASAATWASGSSGGGWVVGDEYVNSVNSFGYAFLPDILFGTYFGDAAAQVYAGARPPAEPREPVHAPLAADPLAVARAVLSVDLGAVRRRARSARCRGRRRARRWRSPPGAAVEVVGRPSPPLRRSRALAAREAVAARAPAQDGRGLRGRVSVSPSGAADEAVPAALAEELELARGAARSRRTTSGGGPGASAVIASAR